MVETVDRWWVAKRIRDRTRNISNDLSIRGIFDRVRSLGDLPVTSLGWVKGSGFPWHLNFNQSAVFLARNPPSGVTLRSMAKGEGAPPSWPAAFNRRRLDPPEGPFRHTACPQVHPELLAFCLQRGWWDGAGPFNWKAAMGGRPESVDSDDEVFRPQYGKSEMFCWWGSRSQKLSRPEFRRSEDPISQPQTSPNASTGEHDVFPRSFEHLNTQKSHCAI